eukprot:scaffold40466_cov21-Tisochrysis_lutea.AAC.1
MQHRSKGHEEVQMTSLHDCLITCCTQRMRHRSKGHEEMQRTLLHDCLITHCAQVMQQPRKGRKGHDCLITGCAQIMQQHCKGHKEYGCMPAWSMVVHRSRGNPSKITKRRKGHDVMIAWSRIVRKSWGNSVKDTKDYLHREAAQHAARSCFVVVHNIDGPDDERANHLTFHPCMRFSLAIPARPQGRERASATSQPCQVPICAHAREHRPRERPPAVEQSHGGQIQASQRVGRCWCCFVSCCGGRPWRPDSGVG